MECNCNNNNSNGGVIPWVRGNRLPLIICVYENVVTQAQVGDSTLTVNEMTRVPYTIQDSDTVTVIMKSGFRQVEMPFTTDGNKVMVTDNGELPTGAYTVEVTIERGDGARGRWQETRQVRIYENTSDAQLGEMYSIDADLFFYAKGDTGTGIADITNNPDGTLTITMTDGTSYVTEVLKGDKGDKGDTGERGVSIVSFDVTGQTDVSVIYTVTFSDDTTQNIPVPKGPQGDTGLTGNGISTTTLNSDYTLTIAYTDGTTYTTPSIRGAQGAQGVSVIGFTQTGETATNTMYNLVFSDGRTQSVAIPKGVKGDKGDKGDKGATGATGAQGPKGDTVIIGDEQTYTLYGVTGQNSDGAMTQKAVTDALVAESISYDNSQSSLAADNVQDALGEVDNELYFRSKNVFELGSIDTINGQNVTKTDGTRIRTRGYVKKSSDIINFTVTRNCSVVNVILYNGSDYAGSLSSVLTDITEGSYTYNVEVDYEWDSYRIVCFTSGYTSENIANNYSVEYTNIKDDAADKLRSIIKDSEEYADVELSMFKKGGYITLSDSTASLTPTLNDTWEYVVFPCQSYDEFIITAAGGINPRAYAFLDSELNVLKVANASANVIQFLTTAPYGTSYFVANGQKGVDTYNFSVVAKKRQNIDSIDDLQLRIDGGYTADFEIGSIDLGTFQTVETNNRLRMTRPMPIIEGAGVSLTVPFDTSYKYKVFYYNNNICEYCDDVLTEYTGNINIKIDDSGTYDSFRIAIYRTDNFTNELCAATHVVVEGISIEQRPDYNVGIELTSLYFVQGNINGYTGADLEANNVIRTFGFLSIRSKSTINFLLSAGYRIGFRFYSAKTSGFIGSREWFTDSGKVICPDGTQYMRIVIASPNGTSTLPVFDDVNLILSVDKKMAVKEFAADADYIENIEEAKNIVWENGAIEFPSGDNIEHAGRIRTAKAYEVGKNFYVSVASGYCITAVYYDKWGNNINYLSPFTTQSSYVQLPAKCYVRFVIRREDNGNITVDDFNTSDVLIPLFKIDARTYNYGVDFDADNATVAGIYNHLHDVAVKHSNYITENILGNDASGDYELRSYTLGNGSKKIFIVVGQHGPQSDPWDSVVTATRFITQLADTTYNSDFAEHLRDEYTLCIVPCANPYGLEHFNSLISDQTSSPGGRYNYNAVNLNRDWGTFSQPETQLIKAKMDAIQPDAIIDLHTTGDYLTGIESIKGKQWTEYTESGMLTMLNALSAKQLQLYNVTLSHNLTTTPSTKLSVWGHSYCEHSMTAECNWWVNGQSEPHSSQIESANMSLLINCIKIMAATIESISYVYERVPKQMQAT